MRTLDFLGAQLSLTDRTNHNGTWAEVESIDSGDAYWRDGPPKQRTWVRAYDVRARPASNGWLSRMLNSAYEVSTAADVPDPRQVQAQCDARAKTDQHGKACAEVGTPPSLVFYSLYMHTSDYASYRSTPARSRPAWWQGATLHRVLARNKDPHPRDKRPGLNIRKTPNTKHTPIGWLARNAEVVLTGTNSDDGKWGQIQSVHSGDSSFTGKLDEPALHLGWVHLKSLDRVPTPDECDSVVCLKTPHAIRAGAVVDWLGEDVPWYAQTLAGMPATRPLLHMEVFSGEDVRDFIARCRKWDKKLADSTRTLLALREGDIVRTQPDAEAAKAADIRADRPAVPLASLKSHKDARGKIWRQVSLHVGDRTLTGWIEEEGRKVSPWAWHGVLLTDALSSDTGAWWDDPDAAVAFLRGRTERPSETPFAQAVRQWLDLNKDGHYDEHELDTALKDRALAPRLGAIIPRHRSAWDVPSWEERYLALEAVAEKHGNATTLQQIRNEKPRVERLQWWNKVATGVEGFPQDSRVYHFHPVGLAGGFGATNQIDELIRRIGDIISHGEGTYESYNTGTKDVPGGRVGFSFLRPAAGTVTEKTINQILSTERLSGLDKNRMFATGKYQTIFATLRAAAAKMNLSGEELYDEEMQERIFREFLITKAGGGALAKFIVQGLGTVDEAQYAASKEWASIAAPSGKMMSNKKLSDGSMSYHQDGANTANKSSTNSLRAILHEIEGGQ